MALGDNPDRDAQELLGIVQARSTMEDTFNGLILADVDTKQVPLNTVNHKVYYCILLQKESQILASKGIPFLFHRKVYEFAVKLAKEMKGTLKRADRVMTSAQRSVITLVTVVDQRKKRKLSRYEQKKRAFDKAKSDPSRVPKEQSKPEVNIADDLDMPPVSGTEHPSDGEQQDTKVYELPSNNTVAGNKNIN